jgi:hypothetical protein
MVAAARTGSLQSPESQAVAANLVWAYQQANLTVPAFLAAIEPIPTALHDPAESRPPGYTPSRSGRPPAGLRGPGPGRRTPDGRRQKPPRQP